MADPDSAALAGTSIVWIDDQPETNRSLITFLTARGASVVLATDRASALEAFQQGEPTVVLTDFGRGGDPDAGIDDLAFFRSTGRYEGPVLFCSGRGTAKRRRRIVELGALGPTNDENEIVRLIFAIKSEQFRVGGTPRS